MALAPLVISDARPILPLTSFGGRPLTSVGEVSAAVRSGAVRYGLVAPRRCDQGRNATAAGCVPAAVWIRQHGIDVTGAVGLTGRGAPVPAHARPCGVTWVPGSARPRGF